MAKVVKVEARQLGVLECLAPCAGEVRPHKPWDTAAGVLIAREAGAIVTDIDGSPHTTNARATIAAAPKILADLVELVAGAEKDAERRA
ncbi:inositol monophosphatase [Microbispora sp. NPDC049125]|uniref:inositol monophosphatase family protein n=1 Tax=Microbispora sp. NPDC049125 TaxID=3154929 RepID=UPI003467B91D